MRALMAYLDKADVRMERRASLRNVLLLGEKVIGMFGMNRSFSLCRFQWIVSLNAVKTSCRSSFETNDAR